MSSARVTKCENESQYPTDVPCPGLNEESHPCVLHGASTLPSKLGCLDVEEDMALPDPDFWDTPVEIDMLNPKIEVWMMIFVVNLGILRFHVDLCGVS